MILYGALPLTITDLYCATCKISIVKAWSRSMLLKVLFLAVLIEARRKKTHDHVAEMKMGGVEVNMDKSKDNLEGDNENEQPEMKGLRKSDRDKPKIPMWSEIIPIYQMATLNNQRPNPKLNFRKSNRDENPWYKRIPLPKDPERSPVVERTTCEEFAKKAVFYPDDILGIEWLPFYIWSLEKRSVANVHTFMIPTVKLVNQYKQKYSRFINETIDWDQPKLVMREFVHFETLLIAVGRSGMFIGILDVEISDYMYATNQTIELQRIRLKIMDPYLVMMYCESQEVKLMAVASAVPNTEDEKMSEAKILKIRGPGFPISRSIEAERLYLWSQQERRRHLEEIKMIRVDY